MTTVRLVNDYDPVSGKIYERNISLKHLKFILHQHSYSILNTAEQVE